MGTVVIVVVPRPELGVEEANVIGDSITIEQLVELLVVHAMGSFDLAVQMRRARPDLHVPDVELLQMAAESGLEFGTVVGLHDPNPKREASPNVVQEADGGRLVALLAS